MGSLKVSAGHHVWTRQLKRLGEPVGAEREAGKGEGDLFKFDRLFSAGAGYLGLTIGAACVQSRYLDCACVEGRTNERISLSIKDFRIARAIILC